MLTAIITALRDETGATVIEYALIAALIAVVIVGAVSTVGSNNLTNMFNVTANAVAEATGGSGG